MRKLGIIIHYYIYILMMWRAIHTCKAYERLARNPLEGSRARFPGDREVVEEKGGGQYSYRGNEEVARLLDVGACSRPHESTISFVPPLDGASPSNTLCQTSYAMKFVLFDLQLVELKSVDAVAGSFTVELQMILHWIDSIVTGSNGIDYTDDCSFLCDTNSPRPLCCDNVWVPPLRLSGCDIHEIKSSTPTPQLFYRFETNVSYLDCFTEEHNGECYWRRIWYLNIDATCASKMDFRDFPFDVQSLTIDLLNPYASRTWFQLTKGFLQDHVDEGINNVDLSPDRNIPGWFVKDLKVSSTCGTSESWKPTFLTQDKLLKGLNTNSNGYDSQDEEIVTALSPQRLICPKMEDLYNSKGDMDSTRPTNFEELYMTVRDNYEERVNSTLQNYRQCMETKNTIFSWNVSEYKEDEYIAISKFGYFSTSIANIKRSFNILDLEKETIVSKVWFPCAIEAVANLTTPGIQVTILVQRYQKFYVMKLILPTIACVAFSFAAFGLHPKDLVGRLTVVVPSAIALTALQSLVVATDIPPVAYIAPSTYIFIFSYLAQILISFESVLMKCLDSREKQKWWRRGSVESSAGPAATDAPIMHHESIGPYNRTTEGFEMCTLERHKASTGHDTNQEPNGQMHEYLNGPNTQQDPNGYMSFARKFDIFLMFSLGVMYTMAILVCTLFPWQRSSRLEKETSTSYVSLWQGSTN